MTQEDWSGTGETSETSNAGSWSDPAAAADETWGDSAIGEASEGAEAERSIAVPATTRSSSRSGSRSSSRSGSRSSSSRKKSSAKKSSAKSGTKKKSAAKK